MDKNLEEIRSQAQRAALELCEAAKLKSGDILEMAEVVRNMTRRDQRRGLSTTEKKMLDNARRLLVSELALVEEVDPDRVNNKIGRCLSA